MQIQAIPDEKQLRDELREFAKRGLGRSLPGRQSEETVKGLSDISRVLAKDSNEDWPLRIGRVVLEEVESFTPPDDKLAIADVLAIDLEQPIEEFVKETAGPLWSKEETEGRYARAAMIFNLSEREFAEKKRLELLGRLAKRLLERIDKAEEEAAEQAEAQAKAAAEAASNAIHQTAQKSAAMEEGPDMSAQAPRLLVGGLGVLLMLVGIAWLISTATGVIG